MGHTACTEPQCLYSRAIPLLPLWAVRPVQSLSACTVELYLYSPYGPYGLYRASVPVQGCTLPFTFKQEKFVCGHSFLKDGVFVIQPHSYAGILTNRVGHETFLLPLVICLFSLI